MTSQNSRKFQSTYIKESEQYKDHDEVGAHVAFVMGNPTKAESDFLKAYQKVFPEADTTDSGFREELEKFKANVLSESIRRARKALSERNQTNAYLIYKGIWAVIKGKDPDSFRIKVQSDFEEWKGQQQIEYRFDNPLLQEVADQVHYWNLPEATTIFKRARRGLTDKNTESAFLKWLDENPEVKKDFVACRENYQTYEAERFEAARISLKRAIDLSYSKSKIDMNKRKEALKSAKYNFRYAYQAQHPFAGGEEVDKAFKQWRKEAEKLQKAEIPR